MKFKDVLETLCTELEVKSTTDFQTVFAIRDPKEGKIAFDVLRSYGIECKVYHEEDSSKLYVTNPSFESQDELDDKLAHALAYCSALKSIKEIADTLCQESAEILDSPDYTMAFVNAPGGAKQIVVNVLATSKAPEPRVAQHTSVSSQPQRPRPQNASAGKRPPGQSRYFRPPPQDTMFSGPQLLQDNNRIISKKELQKQDADSYWHQLSLYLKGNSAVAFGIIVVIIMFLFSVFSMFVVSKGFLCPDLAAKKNPAWYCKPLFSDPEEEEKNKNKLDLGLPSK